MNKKGETKRYELGFLNLAFFAIFFIVFLLSSVNAVDISTCQNLSTAGTTYVMAKNLENGELNSTGCFIISAQNITLDCNGFYIKNTTLGQKGIYSTQVNTTIKNCNVTMSSAAGYGIFMQNALNSFVFNTTVFDNYYGFYMRDCQGSIVQSLIADSNNWGVYLDRSNTNHSFYNINVTSNGNGLYIWRSSNNTFENITANSNTAIGAYFFDKSHNNTISNVNASFNADQGIYFKTSDNNTLQDSYSTNNNYGVKIESSSGNVLRNNSLSNNTYWNFELSATDDLDSNNTLDASNIVDDSYRIYYNYSLSDYVFDLNSAPNAGMVICAKCHNVTVRDLNLSHENLVGLYLFNTTNSSVINTTSNNNYYGIRLDFGSGNSLQSVTSNLDAFGIYLSGTENNDFINSTASYDNYGVYMLSSSNHNRFNNFTSKFDDWGVYTTNIVNNTFSALTSGFNNYGLLLDSNTFNTTLLRSDMHHNSYALVANATSLSSSANNTFSHNLNTVIINSSTINENLDRAYPKYSNISFNLSILSANGTQISNYNYSLTVYPTVNYSMSNNSNILTINLNSTKEGIYNVVVNVTSDTNDNELRDLIFIFGNESYATERYYMHNDLSTHSQYPGLFIGETTVDGGSMFSYVPTTEEERRCSVWIQYQPDEILNFYPVIKNVSMGLYYKGDGTLTPSIQKYATYDGNSDYSASAFPDSVNYIFNMSNLTGLNLTSDYLWRFYWLSFKVHNFGGTSVYVHSNATEQSYADFTYLYAGPQITYFGENSGSDVRNMRILSSVFNDDAEKNVTLQFEGEGNFTIVLNLTSANYTIKYDNTSCPHANCTINYNTNGTVNLTLSLGSLHALNVYETVAATAAAEATAEETITNTNSNAPPAYSVDKTQLEQGYERILGEGFKLIFDIGDDEVEGHTLTVEDISVNRVRITIKSNPITFDLGINETKKLDLNRDGFYDFEILLKEIKWSSANFVFKKIREKVSVEQSELPFEDGNEQGDTNLQNQDQSAPPNNRIRVFLSIVVLLILAIVVIIILVVKRRRHRKIWGYRC